MGRLLCQLALSNFDGPTTAASRPAIIIVYPPSQLKLRDQE